MKIEINVKKKHLDVFLNNIDLFVEAIDVVHKLHSQSSFCGNSEIGVYCKKYRKSYIVDVNGDEE